MLAHIYIYNGYIPVQKLSFETLEVPGEMKTVSSQTVHCSCRSTPLFFKSFFTPKKMDKASANFSCLPSLKLT